MKHLSARDHVRGSKRRMLKWVCLFLLILMLIPITAASGSTPLFTSGPPAGEAGSVYNAVYGFDPVIQPGKGSVTDSVYGWDDTLGVILDTEGKGIGKLGLLSLSPVNGTLQAASPLLQQLKLTQASAVVPGGRGFMLPQVVIVKDPAGNPLPGVPVTFQVSQDSIVTAVMRGLNSTVITVATDANGIASAANTYTGYVGEGYQVYSKSTGVIKTMQVTATVAGLSPVTFQVEIGAVGSNMLDTTPPTITANAQRDDGAAYIAGTWTNRTVTVSYTAVDTLSAIRFCTPDQIFNTEGAGQLATGKAIDSAATSDDDKNHTSTITFGPINIDKSPPNTTATAGAGSEEWNHDAVTVQLQSEDSLSGVDAIYYKVGDQGAVRADGNTATVAISTEGTTNVTYWAVDKTGNEEAAQSVAVKIDKNGPLVSSVLSPKANEKGWNSTDVTVTITASDSSSGVKEIHYKVGTTGQEQAVAGSTAAFAVQTEGITPITYWAADQAGNLSSVQTAQVKIDKTVPVLKVPASITLEATAVRSPVAIGTATVQDVSIPDVVITNDAPADYPIGTTSVVWKAEDPVGNISSQVQKITVVDTTKPVITVQGDVVVEATAIRTPYVLTGATAKDIFPVILVNDAPKDFPIGKTVVIWTATDANGNSITTAQNVTVNDSTKPKLTVPKPITLEATGRRTPVDIGQAEAHDIFEVTVTHNAPSDFPVGTTDVQWKAKDANGNEIIEVQKITVTDTTAPVLVIPKDITVEATARRMKLDLGKPQVTDIFDTTWSNDAPADFPVGKTLVIWTAVDENHNTSTATQTVQVTDKTSPVLTVPADIKLEATAVKTRIDNLGTVHVSDIFPTTYSNNAPLDGFPVGNTVVTWTVLDENGNKTEGTQNVTITDTTKPLLMLPGNKVVEATGLRTKVELGNAVGTDIFPVTVTHDGPADYPLGETLVTWTAVDANGNKTTGTQTVKVVDTTKPVMTVPADLTLEATAVRTSVDLGQPKVTDLFPVTTIHDAPADFPVGETEVKWLATDSSGNVALGIQKVTITDKTAPVLHIPVDVKVEASAVRTPVAIGEATADDIFAVTITHNAPADYPVGTTPVTWTAVDANGNISTLVQKVVIEDTKAPVLTVPQDITTEATAVTSLVDTGKATATDIFEVKITNNAPERYPLGKTVITWKATDANGNISTKVQTITVVDTTAPAIVKPADLTVEAAGKRTVVSLETPAATDIFKVTGVVSDAPADFPLGKTVVTWTATDENRNSSVYKQNVTVVDTTAPVLKVPKDMEVEAAALETPVSIGSAEATDLFPVTVTSDAPEKYLLGETRVTWTAKDENGNETTAVQVITIKDTTAPVLDLPDDVTVEATALETPVDIGEASAADIYSVEITSDAPAVYKLGETKVTWKAVDANGNESTGVQKVTVVDTTAPILSVPENVTAEAAALDTPVKIGLATATDIYEVTVTSDAPAAYKLGETKVTWKAVDANGNVSTGVQTVTVVDTTKPVLKLPADQTVEATGELTKVILGKVTATDIYPVDVYCNTPDGFRLGVTKVTCTATDPSGNVATGIVTITVVDTIKPVLTLPEDKTVEATALHTPVEIGTARATDIFPVTVTSDAPESYLLGVTKVTWKAVDANGNESIGVQTITVVDTTAPVLTVPEDITAESVALETPVDTGLATATDIYDVVITKDAPETYKLGETKVTWKAVDTNGNETVRVQKVTIVDTTAPVLTVPEDVTAEAASLETPIETGLATAADIYEVAITSDAPAAYKLGETKVTWKAVDANGNESTGVQKVTIVDTTAPVLTVPEDVTAEATALDTPVEIGLATATDIYEVAITSDAPAAYKLGENKVTWKAVDANGNETVRVQKVTIVDTTAPVLTVPEDVTAEAAALDTPVETGLATAADIYDVTITNDAPAAYKLGETKVTWRAVDANGNESVQVQKITIVDTTAPVLEVPADVKVEATALETPVEIGLATASDIYEVTVTSNAPAAYKLGENKVIWKAVDANGNISTGVQTVTVEDTTAPVLTVPENVTAEATALNTPVDTGLAAATDIYNVVITNDAPATYKLGETKVLWKAVDANGNASSGIQIITIVDTTAPALKVPANQTVEATAVKTPVTIGEATATDIYPVTVTSDAPAAFSLGETKVTWKAVDANDNESTGVQIITVVDTTKPVLMLPADKTVEATAVMTPVSIGEATATDIFPVKVISDAPTAFSLGKTKVTWWAVDANGNESRGVQTITVVDLTKPVLTLPANKTVEATAVKTPVTIGEATATDIFPVTVASDAPTAFSIGETKVTWKAVDANGNESTGVQIITVVDTTKPVLTLPANKTVEATAVKTPVTIGQATAADIFPVTVSSNTPTTFSLGETKVTWKALDANGNESTGVQIITVVDTTKPVFTLPANKTVEATAVKTPVTIGQATATDIFPVTVTSDAPTAYPLGLTKVTWTATDANGNVTKSVQTITIVDTTKPVIVAPADKTAAATGTKTVVALGQPVVTDIFGYTVTNDAPTDGFPVGTTTVTWTATDISGNSAKAVQKVTIVQAVKVQAYNSNRYSSTNTIAPRIALKNIGSEEISLSSIKFRYYYTIDTEKSQDYDIDYANVSGPGVSRNVTSYVTGNFQKTTVKTGSDYYIEYGFTSTAGKLKPGETVLIQSRFWKSDWSNYKQTNDYSYNSSAEDYTDTNKITVYSSGTLIAGIEP
jgi:large repetitive protein